MKTLDLLDSEGSLTEDATLQIFAHCIFPDDPASQRQVLLLASDEKCRMGAGGAASWRPTGLVERLITSMRNEAGQRAVAGQTAIAFSLLSVRYPEKTPSLYAASKVVCRAMEKAKKKDPTPFKSIHMRSGLWEVEDRRCPTTQQGISKAWNDYCSVSHLLAAESILAEWFPMQNIFERTPDYPILLMRTAAVLEAHIREPIEERGKEVLQVAHQFSGSLESLPPLALGGALVEFLTLGLGSDFLVS